MLDLIRYALAITFLIAAIWLGVKGFMFGASGGGDLQSHKKRAIYYTFATVCGFASFGIYYPALVSLVCLSVLLIGIWIEYFTAASLLNKK